MDWKKFTSRKFIVAAAGLICGVALAMGANASEIQTVSGAVVAVASAIGYIFGEASVDAAAVKKP